MGLGDMLGSVYDVMKAKLSEALITGILAYLLVAFALPGLSGIQQLPNIPIFGQAGVLGVRLLPSQAMSAGVAAFFASLAYDVVLGPLGLGNLLSGVL